MLQGVVIEWSSFAWRKLHISVLSQSVTENCCFRQEYDHDKVLRNYSENIDNVLKMLPKSKCKNQILLLFLPTHRYYAVKALSWNSICHQVNWPIYNYWNVFKTLNWQWRYSWFQRVTFVLNDWILYVTFVVFWTTKDSLNNHKNIQLAYNCVHRFSLIW